MALRLGETFTQGLKFGFIEISNSIVHTPGQKGTRTQNKYRQVYTLYQLIRTMHHHYVLNALYAKFGSWTLASIDTTTRDEISRLRVVVRPR